MKRGEDLYLEIYIDLIFIINFFMDYILLNIVMKILKWESSLLRRLIGAGIGAVGACILVIIPGSNFFIQFLLSYFLICGFMIYFAFRPKTFQMGFKGVIALYGVTFLLGGLLNSLYYHSSLGYYFHELINGRLFMGLNGKKIVILAALGIVGIIILLRLFNYLGRGDVDLYEIKLYLQNKSMEIIGLMDTGNNLSDPIFGKPVIIIEYSSLKTLLSKEQVHYIDMWVDNSHMDMNHNLNKPDNINVFMIPFRSIGKKKGLLVAIKINKLEILKGDEKIVRENVLTGIWDGQFSKNNKYQLILHRDIL